jgi:protein SCO1/2
MAAATMNSDKSSTLRLGPRLRRAVLAGLLALLPPFAFACTARDDPPLAGAAIGGPFALVDQDGRRVSDRDFAGRYRIVYFGYTHCPDACPTDLATLGQALARFDKEDPERAALVQPLFISVDPERDTPALLKLYVASFHPRLEGLTGSPAEIAAVAREYVASYGKGPVQPGGGYAMSHSRQMLLMGPTGGPIALLPADQGVDATLTALERWVR